MVSGRRRGEARRRQALAHFPALTHSVLVTRQRSFAPNAGIAHLMDD